MNEGRRSAAGWALAATATTALAAVTIGAGVVAVAGDGTPATTTTTVPRASSTSTAPLPREQASLVTDEQADHRVEWHGVTVTAAELLALTGSDPSLDGVPPVIVDPAFVAAQRADGVELGRLRAQLEFVAERFLPVAGDVESPGPPATHDLAVVGPLTASDDRLLVPVMVFNPGPAPQRLRAFDLRLLAAGGTPLTERVRFEEGLDALVAPGGAYFNTVYFSSDQVVGGPVPAAAASYDATAHWSNPGEDG